MISAEKTPLDSGFSLSRADLIPVIEVIVKNMFRLFRALNNTGRAPYTSNKKKPLPFVLGRGFVLTSLGRLFLFSGLIKWFQKGLEGQSKFDTCIPVITLFIVSFYPGDGIIHCSSSVLQLTIVVVVENGPHGKAFSERQNVIDAI